MKVIELVEHSAQRLERAGVHLGHGTFDIWDEAAWLVLWALGRPLDSLDEVAQRPVGVLQLPLVHALIERRIRTRQPAAYLTSEAWLHGLSFYVDERTIVPRSLIAQVLVDHTLLPWLDGPVTQILDLCTGNGSLAIFAALLWPDAQIQASDLSASALVVAQRNAHRHGVLQRIEWRHGDGLNAAPGPHDLILCNPPYVNARSMRELPQEYQAEPAVALAGGEDGMDFIRVLMQQAAAALHDAGALVLEIGHERAHFEAAFAHLDPIWLPTVAGDDQVMLLHKQQLLACAGLPTGPGWATGSAS